jgi:hypothetical protein
VRPAATACAAALKASDELPRAQYLTAHVKLAAGDCLGARGRARVSLIDGDVRASPTFRARIEAADASVG